MQGVSNKRYLLTIFIVSVVLLDLCGYPVEIELKKVSISVRFTLFQ